MSAPDDTTLADSIAERCGVCPWRMSMALVAVILSLSVFGAGVVVGQMISRDLPACIPAVWP